jgi:hypothetical protein
LPVAVDAIDHFLRITVTRASLLSGAEIIGADGSLKPSAVMTS